MPDLEGQQAFDVLLAGAFDKYPNMRAIAEAITSLPDFDRSALEREEFWSLVVALEDEELPTDVVAMTFDGRDGVLATTPARLVLVIRGDEEGLVNTAAIPHSEVKSVQQKIAKGFRNIVVMTTSLTWTFEHVAEDHASRFSAVVARSAGHEQVGPPPKSDTGALRTVSGASLLPRSGGAPKRSKSAASLSPAKIVIGAIVLLVVVIGACTAAVGCNDCESAWDKCTQGDCSDWDRATDNGRSDRCDYLINERFR